MLFLFLITSLPLLEIAGFIWIGGKIGIGLSLLWVVMDTVIGFALLANMGGQTLRKAKKSIDDDIYPFEEMFDGFCIIIGALLLIFPGFISDFIALPLLVTPVRAAIFRFLKYQHTGLYSSLGKNSEGFTKWYYEEKSTSGRKTIEGEFRNIDDDKKLP